MQAFNMTDAAVILIATVFVNNFVLVNFLGLCPFLGASRQIPSALGMGMATGFVLTLAAIVSYLVHHYLLVPFRLEFLRILSFIFAIAVVVQFTELVVRRSSPLLHNVLGIYLPLITTNCVVLGVALLNVQAARSLFESALFGFGAAAGFALVMLLFAGIRARLEAADVPLPFRGAAIALTTAGLLSLAFMGFSGLVRS